MTTYLQKIMVLSVALALAACTHKVQKTDEPQVVSVTEPEKPEPAKAPEPQPEKKAKETGDTQKIFDQALELCESSQEFWAEGDHDNAISALDQAYDLILRRRTSG
jgi:hypothetical protein